MCIFALLGMQVFGARFNYNPLTEKPRGNFDSFYQSLLTVFQVKTTTNVASVVKALFIFILFVFRFLFFIFFYLQNLFIFCSDPFSGNKSLPHLTRSCTQT
jgi:hypothetical protein